MMSQDKLPKRTGAAILLMMVSGVLLFCNTNYVFWRILEQTNSISRIPISTVVSNLILSNESAFLIPILFILFAYFLKRRKKWAWFAALVLLSKEVVIGIYSLLYIVLTPSYLSSLQNIMPGHTLAISTALSAIYFIFVLLSSIFLILDKKEYWQISS